MDDVVRDALRQLIVERGTALAEDARLCGALLRDVAGDRRREISVLVAAVEEGVAADLLRSAGSGTADPLLGSLQRRLEQGRGLAPDAARWAVETWAYALRQQQMADTVRTQPPRQTEVLFPPPSQAKDEPEPEIPLEDAGGPPAHRSRAKLAYLLVGALVLTAAVGVGAWALTGRADEPTGPASPPPSTVTPTPTVTSTPTIPPGFETEAEVALWQSVPQTECESAAERVAESADFPDDVYAAIVCFPSEPGIDFVDYWEFYDDDGMNAEYEATVTNRGVGFDQGGCKTDSVAEHSWSTDESEGRVFCWVSPESGAAVISWTTTGGRSIYAYAFSESGDEAALYDWWSGGDSGP